MSYYNVPAIGGNNPDYKKIYNYTRLMNERLQYCFRNITPEDNFSQEAFLKYQETDEHIGQLELSMEGYISRFQSLKDSVESSIQVMDGKISLKVSADELCSEISATTDTITFRTGYIIIDTKNLKVYKDGSAEFLGSIRGGSININNRFIVTDQGATTIDSITFAKQIRTNGMLFTNYIRISGEATIDGQLNCDTMNVSGTVSCEELYQRSDRRLKENLQKIDPDTALQLVLGLRPVVFRYKRSGERAMGYIAQEVDALQERIGTDLPLVDHSGEYLAIPYTTNSVLYAGAIQAQQKELDGLEQMMEALTHKEENRE